MADITAGNPEKNLPLDTLISELHVLFEKDQHIAGQQKVARCGICYLHYYLQELVHHADEGYYVCERCLKLLTDQKIPMVRKQVVFNS